MEHVEEGGGGEHVGHLSVCLSVNWSVACECDDGVQDEGHGVADGERSGAE